MDKFCTELNALLVDTYASIQHIEETMLSDLSRDSLTIAEMHLIEAIGQAEGAGRTIGELAQATSVSPPSVTVAVNRLVKKGYVAKARGERDARHVFVTLTVLGQRAEISHRFFHRQMVHALAKTIPEADKAPLLSGLTILNDFFKEKAGELAH